MVTSRGFSSPIQWLLIVLLFASGTAYALEDKIPRVPSKTAEITGDAFVEHSVTTLDQSIDANFALILGESKQGSRVTVSIVGLDETNSQIRVNTDSPQDPELERMLISYVKQTAQQALAAALEDAEVFEVPSEE